MAHVFQSRLFQGATALAIGSGMLLLSVGVAVAAPGGTRPGWGCGDTNHTHTGPPGLGEGAVSPCGHHGSRGAPETRTSSALELTVTAPGSTTAGAAFDFTVTAVDGSGTTLTTFADTVRFTSSDQSASLPANSTLTNGSGTFSATLRTTGHQTITATDTGNESVVGTSSVIDVSTAAVTHFAIAAPATVRPDRGFRFTVEADDQFNNAVPSYTGTVHFTSTDGSASLPVDSTLTNGSGRFTAVLHTSGSQTVSATDTSNSSLAGTSAAIVVTS